MSFREFSDAITETVRSPPIDPDANVKDGAARPKQAVRANGPRSRTFTAAALQTMEFPPLTYLLPGLIPEGLCLLVSRPKLGKSWLVLDIAAATAAGRFVLGDLKPASGEVLYLALEDGKRRLQRRMDRLLPTFSGTWPEGVTFATEWARSDQGGLAGIEDWINGTIEKGKHPRLVIVDTLAQFRKLATGKQIYLEDYTAISELQKLASKYNLAIIVVHHDRKGGADDVFDTVSGSLGLTGAADTIAVIKRQSGSVTLHIRGRDVEEAEKAIQFNKDTCRWTMLGEASEVRRSDQRAKVLAVIGGATDGMSPTDLADELGITSTNAKQLLRRMANDGEIQKRGRGRYFKGDGAEITVTSVTFGVQGKNTHELNGIGGDSDKVTEVTPILLRDHLGSPGGNSADFLEDTYPAMPEFLVRRQ
jgi:hypothetical protein